MVTKMKEAFNAAQTRTQTSTILALLSVFMILIALILLFFVEIPKENKSTVDILIGAMLSQGFSGVYQFYFGSNKSSEEQVRSLTRIAESDTSGGNSGKS